MYSDVGYNRIQHEHVVVVFVFKLIQVAKQNSAPFTMKEPGPTYTVKQFLQSQADRDYTVMKNLTYLFGTF